MINKEDPYSSPEANILQDNAEQTYKPRFFSLSGRIGRVRFIAYNFLCLVLTYLLIGLVSTITLIALTNQPANVNSSDGSFALSARTLFFVLPLLTLLLIGVFIIMIRRLNDINMTGWLCLLSFVPFINIIFYLILLLFPGSKNNNNYGPVPTPNTVLTYIGAFIFPAIITVGVISSLSSYYYK